MYLPPLVKGEDAILPGTTLPPNAKQNINAKNVKNAKNAKNAKKAKGKDGKVFECARTGDLHSTGQFN